MPGILIGIICACALRTSAQDSIPKPNSKIAHLKQSLDQVAPDADQAAALLQTSKDLHYLPGQVVALCELAGVYDGDRKSVV